MVIVPPCLSITSQNFLTSLDSCREMNHYLLPRSAAAVASINFCLVKRLLFFSSPFYDHFFRSATLFLILLHNTSFLPLFSCCFSHLNDVFYSLCSSCSSSSSGGSSILTGQSLKTSLCCRRRSLLTSSSSSSNNTSYPLLLLRFRLLRVSALSPPPTTTQRLFSTDSPSSSSGSGLCCEGPSRKAGDRLSALHSPPTSRRRRSFFFALTGGDSGEMCHKPEYLLRFVLCRKTDKHVDPTT